MSNHTIIKRHVIPQFIVCCLRGLSELVGIGLLVWLARPFLKTPDPEAQRGRGGLANIVISSHRSLSGYHKLELRYQVNNNYESVNTLEGLATIRRGDATPATRPLHTDITREDLSLEVECALQICRKCYTW